MSAAALPIAPASVAREPMRAPFPWFGGKSRVAPLVWDRFGNAANYCEPFFGSGAVLLGRPHTPGTETVNDKDCMVANFWRALQADPEGVERWADWPVNEADLHARHLWLVNRAAWRERMKTDPDYFDVKIAGWWVWGVSQWIGTGWCQPKEMRRADPSRPSESIKRVKRNLPLLNHDQGIRCPHRAIPNVARGGERGLLRPSLDAESGKPGTGDADASALAAYLRELAARLRRVRVCCGDWSRIVTPAVTTCTGVTAVFLDPPYAVEDRDGVYAEESRDVAHQARAWALANGDSPDLRICLAGYDGEHAMPARWKAIAWKANGGYGNLVNGETRGRANAKRETLWFSPPCLEPQPGLFDSREGA